MTVVESFQIEWFDGITPEREQREAQLIAAGRPLPIKARSAWARAFPAIRTSLLVVTAPNGAVGALGLERHPSRALPGHYIVRVSRAGAGLPPEAFPAAIGALTAAMRRDPRILRVHFECFSRDAALRDGMGEDLRTLGYRPLPQPTNYAYTLVTDLRAQDDATHLASLAQGVRQNIRALSKYPVELRPITDPLESARMNELMVETLGRTGARHTEQDYGATILFSVAEPSLSHLVGLYRTDMAGPDSLIAFAWGLNQGDHVAYDIGASARIPEFKSLSLGYSLLWELITWARGLGMSWFDFGGISQGTSESDDHLGRISDFKRRFEKSVVRVADEWMLEPHPLRAAAAAAVSRGAELVRRVIER